MEVSQNDRVNIIKLAENNNSEPERKSRTAEFELRVKSMGITEEKLVAQKVTIWEGMWAAKRSGDDIRVGIFLSLLKYLEVTWDVNYNTMHGSSKMPPPVMATGFPTVRE